MENIFRLACALVFCAAFQAQAAIVHLPGTTVDFFYDDSLDLTLYGSLSVVGDSIIAIPTNFRAEATNGSSDSASALGTVQVVAKNGFNFESVLVAQQGDYNLSGAGSDVSVSANLTVDSNTSAASTTTALTSASDFTIQGSTQSWSNNATVDLTTAMWVGVSDIDLTLESIIAASTLTNGESAWVQNKFVGGGMVTVMTTPIPLPASLWLLLSGLAGLAGFSRRKFCG